MKKVWNILFANGLYCKGKHFWTVSKKLLNLSTATRQQDSSKSSQNIFTYHTIMIIFDKPPSTQCFFKEHETFVFCAFECPMREPSFCSKQMVLKLWWFDYNFHNYRFFRHFLMVLQNFIIILLRFTKTDQHSKIILRSVDVLTNNLTKCLPVWFSCRLFWWNSKWCWQKQWKLPNPVGIFDNIQHDYRQETKFIFTEGKKFQVG